MLKKFATRELVFIALMSALIFAINLIIGGALIAVTGIPLINGIITGITFGIFTIILARTMPKFGTFTLFLLIYAILEIPTTLGGAPGFWPKIPINTITGLVADIFFLAVNYRKWAPWVGFYILATVNTLTFVYFMVLLGVPGVDRLLGVLWWFIPSYWVIGTFGLAAGEYIFRKLKNKRIIRQIAS